MTISLGDALPHPAASPELFDRLSTRRSASAQTLHAPGPDAAEVQSILTLGARTPDHGKLFPWRFVVMGHQSRHEIAEALRPLAERQSDPKKSTAVLGKLTAAPMTILVISAPVQGHPVPVWEQELSAGAVCMNLEHAASAFGFSTSWITDWYSYEPEATIMFGLRDGERIAGFIHIGTVLEVPLERVRPDVAALTTTLP